MAETATLTTTVEKGLEYLRRRIQIEAAYLFGSQVEGKVHDQSDIDLAVFSPDANTMSLDDRIRLRADLAVDCDPRLELHLFSSHALANARPTNSAGYIVAHGKRLI
jgi:predicted nucleotidyltransferase